MDRAELLVGELPGAPHEITEEKVRVFAVRVDGPVGIHGEGFRRSLYNVAIDPHSAIFVCVAVQGH